MGDSRTYEQAVTRLAPGAEAPEAKPSLLTRAAWAALLPVRLALKPLGWAFRIREPLPAAIRAFLPLLLLVGVIALWKQATTGDRSVASFASLSPLKEREAEIEKAAGCHVAFVTTSYEKSDWSSPETKVWTEIQAVILQDASAYDARRREIDEALGADQYEVVRAVPGLVPKGSLEWKGVELSAKSHFGRLEDTSDWDRARKALEGAGLVLETRDGVLEKSQNSERVVTVVVRASTPGVAALTTAARAALEDVVGPDSYVAAGNVAEGKERLETRTISPALLPSPEEMVDSLPSLLNAKWSKWDDARHWWAMGRPERDAKDAPPRPAKPLDWKKPNEVPFQVASRALERAVGPDWKDWTLLQAVVWSTIRIVMGFLYAAIVAVPLGVVMGSFSKPRAFFEPLRLMGSYLPLPAFLSLTIFWWGTSESQKVGFLAICTFVVLLPQVVMAVESVPQAHVDIARTLGAGRWHQMRHVLLGGAKAEIMRSLRLSFAVGWTWIILAEMINPLAGLGYVIQLGERRTEHRPHIYAVILLIVALAFAMNGTWAWVERRLYPYRDAETS